MSKKNDFNQRYGTITKGKNIYPYPAVRCSGVFRIWQRGHGELPEREPITKVWAEPPAGSRSRAPGQGVKEAKPPEAETLFALTFNGSRKFAHFSKIWKRRKSHIFALF